MPQGKESVLFEVPNEISKSSIEYVTSQLKEIAARLEGLTGKELDLDRLREAIRWSNTARVSFQQVNELMKSKPCPWDGYRACGLGIAGSLFWGSPLRDEINRMLLREMEARTQSGKAFPERYRVLCIPRCLSADEHVHHIERKPGKCGNRGIGQGVLVRDGRKECF